MLASKVFQCAGTSSSSHDWPQIAQVFVAVLQPNPNRDGRKFGCLKKGASTPLTFFFQMFKKNLKNQYAEVSVIAQFFWG
jgi:hypothetical protein